MNSRRIIHEGSNSGISWVGNTEKRYECGMRVTDV